ncbi:MAG: cytochrome c [Deltaproteobacteria bacterium]|nr:cytochrome c [Deltaproteobacteria bacterium]
MNVIRRYALIVAFGAAIALPTAASADDNLLLSEMMLVNKAYRDIVSGVAIESSPDVIKAIEGLHGSKAVEAAHDALKAGKIKTPKNPGKMKEFERMDKEFHKNLDSLLDAAKANKQPQMRSLTKKLLDGCIKCHQTFRR